MQHRGTRPPERKSRVEKWGIEENGRPGYAPLWINIPLRWCTAPPLWINIPLKLYTPHLWINIPLRWCTPPLDIYSIEVVYTPRLDIYSMEVVYTPPLDKYLPPSVNYFTPP